MLPLPAGWILAKRLDDAVLQDLVIQDGKNPLCFQWRAIWFCKFFQIYFWPKCGKSITCGRKNLDSSFFGFRGLLGGHGCMYWVTKKQRSTNQHFQKYFVDIFCRRSSATTCCARQNSLLSENVTRISGVLSAIMRENAYALRRQDRR
jgi:hypothetical protein